MILLLLVGLFCITSTGGLPTRERLLSLDDFLNLSQPERSDLPWETLNEDVTRVILNQIFEDPKDTRAMAQVSSKYKTLLKEFSYGSMSRVGSMTHPAASTALCDYLELHSDKLEEIKEMYVTHTVYEACHFTAERLPNLYKLHVVHVDEPAVPVSDMTFDDLPVVQLYNQANTSFHGIKSLNVVDNKNRTVLHYALASHQTDNRLALLENLLHPHLDINFGDKEGFTALHYCLFPEFLFVPMHRHLNATKCIEILVEHGANPNQMDKQGKSAVHWAASLWHSDPLKALITKGADVDLASAELRSETPMCRAINGLLRDMQIDALMDEPLDVEFHRGDWPHIEEYDNWVRIREQNKNSQTSTSFVLLQANADIRIPCSFHETPLMKSILHHFDVLVMKMLQYPVDRIPINAPNDAGHVPLHWSLQNQAPIMQRLLDLGADVHAENKNNWNVLMIALSRRTRHEINDRIELSLRHGAKVPLNHREGLMSMSSLYDDPFDLRLLNSLTRHGIHFALQDYRYRYQTDRRTTLFDHIVRRCFKLIQDPNTSQEVRNQANELLGLLVDGLDSTIEPFDLKSVDYHSMLFVAYTLRDEALIGKVLAKTPESVTQTFDHPAIQNGDFAWSTPKQKHELLNIYEKMHSDDRSFETKCFLLRHSPRLRVLLNTISGNWFHIEYCGLPRMPLVERVFITEELTKGSAVFHRVEDMLTSTFPNAVWPEGYGDRESQRLEQLFDDLGGWTM